MAADQLNELLLACLVKAVQGRLVEFDSQNFANTAWVFATVEMRAPKFDLTLTLGGIAYLKAFVSFSDTLACCDFSDALDFLFV